MTFSDSRSPQLILPARKSPLTLAFIPLPVLLLLNIGLLVGNFGAACCPERPALLGLLADFWVCGGVLVMEDSEYDDRGEERKEAPFIVV